MPIPSKLSNYYFYHFSYIDNLPSIIDHGLLSTNNKNALSIEHRDVASEAIQERRHEMEVPCDPGGTIHDYVPFYMCVRNPMFLSLLNSKNIDQQGLLIFLFKMENVDAKNVVFTDASANTIKPPNFYNDPVDLDKLDWDAICSQKWGTGGDKDKMHRQMAEVLIKDSVPLSMLDRIVVFNENTLKEVKQIFKDKGSEPPTISYSPVGSNPRYNFFYTKFMIKGQENHSLTTGPETLKSIYRHVIATVKKNRKKHEEDQEFLFEDIEDCLNQLADDFTLINELEGIHELETDNSMHSENVSDHTLKVIEALEKQKFYQDQDAEDRNILKLSAYLHDIGKGPKEKWDKGIQKAYPDHPADSCGMLIRVLSEDFKNLSDYEIEKICLLVTYHDLIGEIFGHNRSKSQLFEIIKDEGDFNMLSALNLADVTALNWIWTIDYKAKIKALKTEVMLRIDLS